MMSRPDIRLLGRALSTRSQERSFLGDAFRLYEELRERVMRRVCGGRREHEFQIGRDFYLSVAITAIGDGQTPDFDIVLGRYHYLHGGRDRRVVANEFRAVLHEGNLVGLRLDAARLKPRRPDPPGRGGAQ